MDLSVPKALSLKLLPCAWLRRGAKAPWSRARGQSSPPTKVCHRLGTVSLIPSVTSWQAPSCPQRELGCRPGGGSSAPVCRGVADASAPACSQCPCLGAHLGLRAPHIPSALPVAPPGCPPHGLREAILGSWSSQAIWGAASIFILDLGTGGPAQAEMPFKGSSALALQSERP